jgi:integrase
MSVYKSKNSPFYLYDFQFQGDRFHGSTKAKSRRDAERIEDDLKCQAREQARKTAAQESGPLTLDVAAGRYWQEVGQHHSGSTDTWANLERLIAYFGPAKLLSDITDDHVAQLVMWRRHHTVRGKRQIAPATVNRSTTEALKKLFTRAKRSWRHSFKQEPHWKEHMLAEPTERVRELHKHESSALDKAIRRDYEPWLSFARVSGLRLNETLLRWSEVNWSAGQITKLGKGGKIVSTPITKTVRAILKPLKGHHPEFAFTYVAKRTRACPKTGQRVVKGQRYPLTYSGAVSVWKRTRKAAKLTDFRFHDIRHDVGTKVLRQTGNLKLTQRVLNHSDIKTTMRYAHCA